MKTMWRRMTGFGTAVALGLTVTACAGDAGEDSPGANGLQKFVVGVAPSITSAPMLSPPAKAIFAKHGLELVTQEVASGPAAVPLLLNGQIDVSLSDPLSVALAADQNVPVGIAAGAAVAPAEPQGRFGDYVALVTKDDSDVKAAKDLNGKKIGMFALNGLAHLLTQEALEKLGADPDSIEWVEIPIAESGAAVERGHVDAAFMVEPFLTAGLGEGLREVVPHPYTTALPGVPQALYIASKQLADEDPDKLERFRAANFELNQVMMEDTAALIEGVLKVGSVEPDLVDRIVLPNLATNEDESLAELEPTLQLLVKYGLLDEAPTADELILDKD